MPASDPYFVCSFVLSLDEININYQAMDKSLWGEILSCPYSYLAWLRKRIHTIYLLHGYLTLTWWFSKCNKKVFKKISFLFEIV